MKNYWCCAILFRIILPLLIFIAAYARPTITSFVYLLIGLYLPFFSVPTVRSMLSATAAYLKLFIVVSILISSLVISFFFALFFPEGDDYKIAPCSPLEKVLRTAGVIDFQNLPVISDAVSWYLPEPLMLVTSLGFFVAFKKLNRADLDLDLTNEEIAESVAAIEVNRKKLLAMLLNCGKYFVVFWFCVASVIKPSVQGVIYYLVFLVVLTYWACNKSLGRVYARILIALAPIISVHLSLLYLYQFQYFQDNKTINYTSIYGRLFQLVSLYTYKDCDDPRLFQLHNHSGLTHAFPGILYVLYHLTVLVSREILQAKDGLVSIFVAFFKREKKIQTSSKWKLAFKKVKQKLAEEKMSRLDKKVMADRIRNAVDQTIQFIIRISYLVANFTMMIWAIVYICWKSLMLLMWANLIWLLPGRRRIMLVSSPFLVAYAWFLLGTSYMYSMKFDIPQTFLIFDFAAGGYADEKYVWLHLIIESLLSVIIFVTMRQFFQERALRRAQKKLNDAMGPDAPKSAMDSSVIQNKWRTWKKIYAIVEKWFALCWIWVVIITMIWMNFMSTTNPLRIVFVALSILCVMTFQICPFNYWKKFLLVYWWIVIIYAMLNLVALYICQMRMSRIYIQRNLYGEELLNRYGFAYEEDARKRFFILANPLFLQIAIVIQKNYLQKNFDKYTSPESPEELDENRKKLDEINHYVKKIITVCTTVKNVCFMLLEIHLQKITVFIGWLLCYFNWCAMFLPFAILLTASCVCGRLFTAFTIHLMSFFVEVLILARLIYMNQYTLHRSWDYVGYYERNGKTYNKTLNTAEWLGFHQASDPQYADFSDLFWCFLFVFMVTLDSVVRIRQRNYKKSRNMSTERRRVLFPEINGLNCHDSTKNMLKFLANYGFCKFGIELTSIVAVVVLAIRMDSAAIMLAIGLLMTFWLNRKWVDRALLPAMLVVAVWIPFQYAMTLGYWPTNWEKSGTRFWNENDFKVRIQQFFHLMNMAHPPHKGKVVCDFLLLMCFSRQWRMFRMMRQEGFVAISNENVGHLVDLEDVENPVPDFITYSRNFLDIYKKLIFHSWFYITLFVTFLAGTVRPTVYSFGYVVAAFFLMWEGSDMFLRPPKAILLRWNLLILYNLTILTFRVISQLFGCILVYEWTNINCKIYNMFDVFCVDRFGMSKGIPDMTEGLACKGQFDLVGLKWDCACFFFLIIQQRIFKSFHFFHIVNDAKAQTILANRGALYIEDQKQEKRRAYDNMNAAIRTNIEKRVQRIHEIGQKIQGDVYLRRKKNHMHMIRSGDYYLFDDVERSLDIPLMPPKKEEIDSDIDPYDPMPLGEYVNCFLTSGVEGVLAERALRITQKRAEKEGRQPEDLKKAIVRREPQPSTSRQPPAKSELSPVKKVMHIFVFLWGLIESIVVTVTNQLNRTTKDFRFILNKMHRDKMLLKEKTNYTQGARVGSQKIWKPLERYSDFFAKSAKEEKIEKHKLHYSIYAKLLKSIWYLVVNQSEWICYLVIVLNQVITGKFISFPLPMMVFCWGALTVPKPTKTFWVTIISYSLIMSMIKNFFVMGLADWNQHTFADNLFYPPTVIGIDIYINSIIELTLLCSLFFHRVVLQWLGLWEPFLYRPSSLIKDGNYVLNDGKFILLGKNEVPKKTPVNIKTFEMTLGDYFPSSVLHGAGKYAEGFRLFIQQLISPSSTQVPVDVYTPMFLCDLINMLLIIFCYGYFENAYGNDSANGMGFIQYLMDNRVPVMYILVITAYFTVMVIDRWIYLRKNRFAKLVYHFFQVISIHLWAFVLYPIFTGRLFKETFVVKTFYVSKCIYFLFSAYQIRNGYPHLTSRHWLARGTTIYHRFSVIVFRFIPYLFELRTLLDWTCTDTCLGLVDWFKMQEIHDCIFDQKCQQDFEQLMSNTNTGGKRKKRTAKYIVGGSLFAFLFLTIIFPFFIFSLGGSDGVGDTTHPSKMTLELYMGRTEPIFNSYAVQNQLTADEYNHLTRRFNNIRASESIFDSFEPADVIVVKWSSHSLSSWLISPGSLKELIDEVKNHKRFSVRVVIRYTHVGSRGGETDGLYDQRSVIPPLPDRARQDLLDMLVNAEQSNRVVLIPLVFPKFLRITKEAESVSLPIMEEPTAREDEENQNFISYTTILAEEDDGTERNPKRLRNLLLALRKENGQMWWQIKEHCDPLDDNYRYYLKDLVANSCEELVMYTFNEKVFTATIDYITENGIVGLYLIYFMVIYGLIKGLMIHVSEIWIEDLPNSDKLFRKCQEVYIARDMRNFELEEELFAELIFIMRSREICIKLTRYEDDPYNPTYITPGTSR